jgi:hypothetical protein
MAILPEKKHVDAREVLNKAIMNTTLHLDLSHTELSKIIGISTPQISRLFNKGTSCINENTKEWECSLLFLRAVRSLESIVGEDPVQAHEWLYNYNNHLAGTPIDMIKNIQGLNEVTQYLDAMWGQS